MTDHLAPAREAMQDAHEAMTVDPDEARATASCAYAQAHALIALTEQVTRIADALTEKSHPDDGISAEDAHEWATENSTRPDAQRHLERARREDKTDD